MATAGMKAEEDRTLDAVFEKSRVALKAIEGYSQEQVDALCRAMGKIIFDNAELLAKEAVEETGLGVYEHKIMKNHNIPLGIWASMKGAKSVGEIAREPEKGIIHFAKPKGIVAAVVPITNPVVTPCGNAMMAIKGRNTLIMAPHPKAKKVTAHTVRLMNEAIKALGAPDNLIQVLEDPTIEMTQALMARSNVVVATGGQALVRAAYSCGKPAYGVGQGNVQVIIDKDADIELAAGTVIMGRTFDGGVICAGEQCIIAPAEMHAAVMKAFVKNGAFYVSDEPTVDKFRKAIFPDGKINRDVVGKSVQVIAKIAGVEVPADTKVIILKATGRGRADLLCKEKMCPVMITLTSDSFEDAVAIAKANLLYEGAGHSVAIYSNTDKHIEYAGNELPVGRVCINQTSIFVNGAPCNGFTPTITLGCGAWGGNSTSENLTYKHLIDVTQVGYLLQPKGMPSPDQIWG
jgi:succinate-semialdehyde dehydrogenase